MIDKEAYKTQLMSLTDSIPSQLLNNENSSDLEMLNQKIRNELAKTLEYNSLFVNEVNLQSWFFSGSNNSWCRFILGWLGLSEYADYC